MLQMSQITIQCRLVASEPTRKLLWELMAEKNTPLINEILWRINNHKDFEQWQSEGKIPSTLVADLCKSLKVDSLYSGQPSRFYLSVTMLVNYIYKLRIEASTSVLVPFLLTVCMKRLENLI